MDVVVTEGYISYKGKLYHAGDLLHLPKTAAQKLFNAGVVAAPAAKLSLEADAPADEDADEGEEELPAPDLKAMKRK